MTESPAAATPYEVLGVTAAATQDELRRAYRRLARETHPDLGGTPERFRQVQLAWERVGTPEDRARYDGSRTSSSFGSSAGGSGAGADEPSSAWAPRPPRRRAESKPRARAFGHPGGQERVRYLELIREWVGLGDEIDDPYDPALVRSAPPEIRRILAKAVAEESTAKAVLELGIAYTIWSNVAAGREPELDHVVLAPSGLYAIDSEDWGSPVRLVKGEVEGDGLAPGEQPARTLARSARAFQKSAGVPFTAQLLVVPDDALEEAVEPVSRGRRNQAFAVRRSVLPHVLRGGLAGDATALVDVFEIRARLQQTVRFV
ncbi:DnaJ domain-containing protein [Frondihabitans peucedani]|uniref:J domain-containing protein n=1 Tax=Frondihabitans peucedani TaxID=598626 RepID=A0ABP8DXB8_9MICO